MHRDIKADNILLTEDFFPQFTQAEVLPGRFEVIKPAATFSLALLPFLVDIPGTAKGGKEGSLLTQLLFHILKNLCRQVDIHGFRRIRAPLLVSDSPFNNSSRRIIIALHLFHLKQAEILNKCFQEDNPPEAK